MYTEDGQIYQVHEGLFINGKLDGLHRVSTFNSALLAWYNNGTRHGKSIEVVGEEGGLPTKIYKQIYYNDKINGTF